MKWRWKGRVPYLVALTEQRAHREAILAGTAESELWLLEHDPVITTGRREVGGIDAAALAAAGYDWVRTERGGLATCHEPGQLVGYLLMDARALGVRATVHALEQGLIGWLEGRGVSARRRPGFPGVWVDEGKIGAVGLHFKRGHTLHGFALNLVNDRRGFRLITPCGIPDAEVVSLIDLDPTAPEPVDAAPTVAEGVLASLLDAAALLR